MALNWKSVTADHVRQACKQVATSASGKRSSRIVIDFEGQKLPAKEVQRTAYLIANRLPSGTELKFSSGDFTLNFLRGLGFQVERLELTSSGNRENKSSTVE